MFVRSMSGRTMYVPKSQAGVAILDLFMTLGVILVMMTIAVMVYNMSTSRVSSISSTQNMSALVDGTRNVFGKSGSFAGIDNQVIVNAGLVPKNMNTGTGAAITSQWNTPITIASDTLISADDSFTISVATVPKNECSTFVSGVESMFNRVSVGGAVVKDSSAGTLFDSVATANACGVQGGVTVDLTAGKASGG